MAFVDYDSLREPFVNVTHRVGKTGDWDDLFVVQAMLEFIYTHNKVLKKTKPTKGPVTVTGNSAADTPILIAHFQNKVLKRAKPQGYINRAVGTAKQKENYTIWMLNTHMTELLAATRSSDTVLSYLSKKVPLITHTLQQAHKVAREVVESLTNIPRFF
jgi:hypothetical protein